MHLEYIEPDRYNEELPQERFVTHMFTTRSYMRFNWLGNVVNRLVLFMVLDILFKSLDFCDIYLYCWVINNLLSSQFLKCIGNFYIFCRSNNVWNFQLLTLVAANTISTKNVVRYKLILLFCYIPFCFFATNNTWNWYGKLWHYVVNGLKIKFWYKWVLCTMMIRLLARY